MCRLVCVSGRPKERERERDRREKGVHLEVLTFGLTRCVYVVGSKCKSPSISSRESHTMAVRRADRRSPTSICLSISLPASSVSMCVLCVRAHWRYTVAGFWCVLWTDCERRRRLLPNIVEHQRMTPLLRCDDSTYITLSLSLYSLFLCIYIVTL